MANLVSQYEDLHVTYAMARTIVDACPATDGARALAQMPVLGEEAAVPPLSASAAAGRQVRAGRAGRRP